MSNEIYKDTDRTVEEHIKQQEEKPHKMVNEPTYKELICWCKLNIKELLQIGFADSDKHIGEHYGGEIGLLNVIDGYVQTLENLIELEIKENHENTNHNA